MSVVGNNRVGIPIVVLHDAEGAVIEVETKKGELIRGLLFEAEDMMNLYMYVLYSVFDQTLHTVCLALLTTSTPVLPVLTTSTELY
jgi:hypothetical protein